MSKALAVPNSSTWTEWSMTSSTGCSGLISAGSPPRVFMASRMAARSTTQGTPVKSCRRTRLGVKAISFSGFELLFQAARARTSSLRDVASVFGAEQVLEQDAQGERQVLGGDALLVEGVEAVDFVFFAADFEGGSAVETIHRHDGLPRGMNSGNAAELRSADSPFGYAQGRLEAAVPTCRT